jgi:hypothetical protein
MNLSENSLSGVVALNRNEQSKVRGHCFFKTHNSRIETLNDAAAIVNRCGTSASAHAGTQKPRR